MPDAAIVSLPRPFKGGNPPADVFADPWKLLRSARRATEA
jgi:hypothetical protein